ncbi:FkbM family methyltransferase [Dyella sp. BiH032]|uniref:FkbM family methyltransferase n=1 Tax=Dyella sp. BiH032 TaxID=3075430 RepID=UPI002892E276|nr:FkbM family methyltransferase [Dyella sp. BiH032]WNL47698.1 FkbM family methyltransferase [Dyella sp. BiH032]
MNNAISQEHNQRLWHTRYGLVTAVPTENPAARSLQLYGEWAEQEIDLLSGAIQEGHTVLEFGADYGAHTLWLAQAVGEKGQVHVAEPARIPFQLLCANVAINGLPNVYTHARWLGGSKGQLPMSALSGRPVHRGDSDEAVRLTTVDDLELEALHLIKMNVPGALLDLLAGATETIRKHRPLLYARLTGIERAEAEVQAIKDLGYRCWSHAPYLFNRDNHAGNKSNVFPGCVFQNVIAAPVESRYEFDPRREL